MNKAITLNLFSKLAILSLTIIICVYCDQSTKAEARSHLLGHSSISMLDNTFYLVYAENTGTMFGVGSKLPENIRHLLFVGFVGIVLLGAIAFVLAKSLRITTVLAVSLVVGGGIGNLIDRVIHNGSVIDFMLIKIGPIESGIFNIADIAITFGTCILCLIFISSNSKST